MTAASKQDIVGDFVTALEAGRIVVATDGSLRFDSSDGTAVEVVVDEAYPTSLYTTFWTDDENGDPVELATVKLNAEVLA